MHAVRWLGQNLGVDISGRSGASPSTTSPGTVGAQQTDLRSISNSSSVEAYFSKVSNVIFGQQAAPGAGEEAPKCCEDVELDENGLPVSKNWYYFDPQLQRWNVAPDAPQRVKDEFAQRLREEDDERTGAKKFPDPPPPPPPPTFAPGAFTSVRSPVTPQYAMPTYFSPIHDHKKKE